MYHESGVRVPIRFAGQAVTPYRPLARLVTSPRFRFGGYIARFLMQPRSGIQW